MDVTIDPKILHSNPCVRNSRLPIHIVLEFLSEGGTVKEVACEYEVDLEDVRLALLFVSRLLHGDPWQVILDRILHHPCWSRLREPR